MEDEGGPVAPGGPTQRFVGVEPILAVPDVVAATVYYRDVLGFAEVWLYGEPPSHAGANRDGVQIQFSRDPELAERAAGSWLWVRIRNVEALYAQHLAAGAEIQSPLGSKPWGVCEYTVRDLNGYRLRFTGNVTERPGVAPAADAVVESRPPTWPELEALIRAVGWERYTNFETAPRVLEAAVYAAMAVADGRAVGCAFITDDGAGFYYVRDVIVHPEWQGRGVGTRMIEALMERLRAEAPAHSLVGLYTGESLHDFYARHGFRGPANGLYGMSQVLK